MQAIELATGKEVEVWCLDGYYGRRSYGYVVKEEGGKNYTLDEFYKKYKAKE